TRETVLRHCHLESARLVVIAVNSATLTKSILETVRRIRPDIPVITRAQYLREAESLVHFPNTDIVIAEFETALELVSRVLRVYGVNPTEVEAFISDSQKRLQKSHQTLAESLRRTISMPEWEFLSSLRPFRIAESSQAAGRTIEELR